MKVVNILFCMLLLAFYMVTSAQERKERDMSQKQMMEKKSIDHRLDSLISATVKQLKITNDTIRAKNEKWQKIDRSIQQKYKK